MKFEFLKKRKFWLRSIIGLILLPLLFLGATIIYITVKQNSIIKYSITTLNKQHKGFISVGETHLSLFSNFPTISFKVDDLKISETKKDNSPVIMDVKDIYVGFNLWDILNRNYTLKSLIIEDGFLDVVIHKDKSINILNALKPFDETTETSEPIDFNLSKIIINNLDIHKKDESVYTDLETFISRADGGFNINSEVISGHIDTEFEMNLIDNGDTTYIKHKHFKLHTDLNLNKNTGLLTVAPSGITMEHGDFELQGEVDTKNEIDLNFKIRGTKPNFDMLIAFAPQELIPVLERYKNAGNIYFNAIVQGPILNQKVPFFDVNFGASEAFLENTDKEKRLNHMGFKGHFTNGEQRHARTTTFALENMTAQLEKGNFSGNIVVHNFEAPDIDMRVNANFNLQFMADFLNLNDVAISSGDISLSMNFHDIIDIDNPQQALNKLNQAYFAELKVANLSLSSKDLPAPLENLNTHLVMRGKQATINNFEMLMGKSDVAITGYLSDLPAIVHHKDTPVEVHLDIKSKQLDLTELTKFTATDSIKTGVDEQIKNLSAGFSFKALANAFTESKYIPKGAFFVDNFYGELKYYPHKLHDFHVDVLVGDEDVKIKDFTGFIDDSDFHFNGLVHNYGFWMQKELNGDVDLDLSLTSNLLRLEDILSYKGENYVPEQYRHEEFEKLALHLNSSLNYKASAVQAIDVKLDKLDTKMKLHPMRFERFTGDFHYENDQLEVNNFIGLIGRTSFNVGLNYYLGKDKNAKKIDNSLSFKANYVDYDQLFPPEEITTSKPTSKPTAEAKEAVITSKTEDIATHANAFNLYELPFVDMTFDVEIDHFIYKHIHLQNLKSSLRTTENHYIYLDDLDLNAAGGHLKITGYFNGSDPKHIYMKPKIEATNVEIDKLLLKFENFGQEHLVADNLKGKVTATIDGKIRVYPDLLPDLDQSEIHMDLKVFNGQLLNYKPMDMLSDYMGDKNLSNIKFDTLQNHIDITKGRITIPSMTIESTLGHMELSGSQDLDNNIDYYLRIPWKIVKEAAKYKLFSSKKDIETDGEDEIIELDPDEKIRYLNLKLSGNIDDFKISMKKAKKK